MSDEYANTGFKGSLADNTAGDTVPRNTNTLSNSDFDTQNYPPKDDTTSSGGYRSGPAEEQPSLIDQSPSGGPIGSELGDARQGRDSAPSTLREGELNPYGGDSLESRGEAEQRLASDYRDRRSEQYESSAARGNDGDVGA
ncbi:hypothetical protein PENSPDRAFT_616398 [Peniophora sp. CONT]|nr:hypothetical protein PENSPDRAFT_616398 [Peniophora sp. CONT]